MNKDLDYIFPDPPEGVDPRALDPERIPESVAIIMDGNGRWAKKRALNRLKGHKAGIEAVREAIRCASDLGVRYLTIYSFSTENWKRPEDEVVGLMADVMCSTQSTVRIGGENIPLPQVQARFYRLDYSLMVYVFECLRRNTTQVRNIRAYLLTTLFNAPLTMNNHYQAEVQHDFGL